MTTPSGVTSAREAQLAGTSVALGEAGVLLTGPPGAGKSDLALRLIDEGGTLVSDDVTRVTRRGDDRGAHLVAHAPERMAGQIEVRGLGLAAVPDRQAVDLVLAARLVPAEEIERLPEPATTDILGVALPEVALDPFAASAVAKLRLAVARAATITGQSE